MTPLTQQQQVELADMARTAHYPIEEAMGVCQEASHLAEQLRKIGINASVSATMTRDWVYVWVTVRPITQERLSDALTRLDLVEDDARRRAHPYGWHDVYLQGLDVPLFVLLDDSAEQVPA